MSHLTADTGLSLTYLRDPCVIEELDQDRILRDIADETAEDDPTPWLGRHLLTEYDHLVLGVDRASGRHIGLLGARDGRTAQEDFLLLETGFIASSARGQNLMRRMIALTMLRIAGVAVAPQVIAAPTCHPMCFGMMQGLAGRFSDATFYPEPATGSISFRGAALSARIARAIAPHVRFEPATGTLRGRLAAASQRERILSRDAALDALFSDCLQPADQMLAVLDLRAADEETVIEDARRLYRGR